MLFDGLTAAIQFAGKTSKEDKDTEYEVIIARVGGIHYIVRKKGAKLGTDERVVYTFKNGKLG